MALREVDESSVSSIDIRRTFSARELNKIQPGPTFTKQELQAINLNGRNNNEAFLTLEVWLAARGIRVPRILSSLFTSRRDDMGSEKSLSPDSD